MRIGLKVSGGVGFFPNLAAPRSLEMADLPAEEREALRRLVAAAPATLPQTGVSAGADRQTYEISIDEDGLRRTITVTDPIADPAIEALVTRLRRLLARR